MKKITLTLTLTLTLFVAFSQITSQQINRLRVISVMELPKYASMDAAVAAGSTVGNIVYVYSSADSGVYVRGVGNNHWIKLTGVSGGSTLDTSFLSLRIDSKLDSIKLIGNILWAYKEGDSTNLGNVVRTGVNQVILTSNANGLTTQIDSIFSLPHKIAVAALSSTGSNKYDNIRFDGTVWAVQKDNSLQAKNSAMGIITDTTLSKIDNNYIYSYLDKNFWRVSASQPATASWFNDTLNVFAKKVYAPGNPNNFTSYSNFQQGVNFTAIRSRGFWWQRGQLDHQGNFTATKFISVEYPTPAMKSFLKVFSQTTVNALQDLVNSVDTVVFSFMARGLNKPIFTEGYFYSFTNSMQQLSLGTSLPHRSFIDTVWTKVEIKYVPRSVTIFKDNVGGWSETATTNNVAFLFPLGVLDYKDSLAISHVRYDQIKTNVNENTGDVTYDTLRTVSIANNGFIVIKQVDEDELHTLAITPTTSTVFHNSIKNYAYALSDQRNYNYNLLLSEMNQK